MKRDIGITSSGFRMLEISFESLFDVLILVLTFQLLQVHALQPSCLYHEEKRAFKRNESLIDDSDSLSVECKITREQDNCMSFFRFLPHVMNISEEFTYIAEDNKERAYVNVTIDSDWGVPTGLTKQTDRFLLQENIGTCWNIQVTGVNYPYQVIIFNLPVSSKYELTAAMVMMDHRIQRCNTTESNKNCSILYNTNLTFSPVPNRNSIHLVMIVEEDSIYTVELISGDCIITCNGALNNCHVNSTYSDIFTLAAKTRHEINFDDLIPSRNYCARIGLKENDCCMIHTETKNTSGATDFTYDVTVDSLSFFPVVAVVIIILVIFLISLYLLKNKLLGVARTLNSPMMDPGECDTSLVLESEIRQLIQLMRDNLQIFLVYFSDNEDFLKLMISFRRLLSIYAQKVWDPYSPEDNEHVQNNIPVWVENILENPNVRIVLVENENAVRAESLWLTGNLPYQYEHFLPNKTFIYTMNSLRRPRDRSRLFIVRLKSSSSKKLKSFDSIRYRIPDHLEQLVFDMGRHLFQRPNSNLQDIIRYTNLLVLYSTEREDFIRDLAVHGVTA